MSEKHRGDPGSEPAEPSWDAFTPITRTTPPPGEGTAYSTGSREADPVPSDTSARASAGAEERPGRRRRLPRAVRAVLLLVAAVVLVAVTVGVQWWDRSAWVADRYPAEVIKDVGRGQSATIHGMSWQLSVAVRPRSTDDNPGATTLVAAVQVTPVSAEEITHFSTPTFEARDRAGHTWEALPTTTLSSLDLHAGKVARLTVVAAVPNDLKDRAELVLSYSGREMLRFAR